jgi:hypothetical protein
MTDDCTHPYASRTTEVAWVGNGRVRTETCALCSHSDEIVECPAGVHSLFDFCPGAVVCQGG